MHALGQKNKKTSDVALIIKQIVTWVFSAYVSMDEICLF